MEKELRYCSARQGGEEHRLTGKVAVGVGTFYGVPVHTETVVAPRLDTEVSFYASEEVTAFSKDTAEHCYLEVDGLIRLWRYTEDDGYRWLRVTFDELRKGLFGLIKGPQKTVPVILGKRNGVRIGWVDVATGKFKANVSSVAWDKELPCA